MASTPFKVVSWSPNDPITSDKLGAMVTNDDWLKENMISGRYGANGISRDTGIRIASGLALVTSRKSADASVSVNFGNYFSNGCKPIVTTGTVSSAQRQIYVTIDGPGTGMQPTRDGFQVHVHVNSTSKTKKISRNFYVAWHALGY